jgi:hypothetical protein
MSKEDNNIKLAERLKHKMFFKNPDHDFMFQYFLTNQGYGGALMGEMYNVARRIDPNNLFYFCC